MERVGEIVRKDFRTAKVFRENNIDFCCGGEKDLVQVCEEMNLDLQKIEEQLSEVVSDPPAAYLDFDSWDLDLLADYIEKKHHRSAEAAMPVLKTHLKKLVEVHGTTAPYLVEIAEVFEQAAGELAQHMKREELILFPYIRRMVKAHQSAQSMDPTFFGSLRNPISVLSQDHENEGEHFHQIEELSNGYEIPEWGCTTYAVTIRMLKEFQDELHNHIHLENNVLFPKAVALEGVLTLNVPD